jgi:nitroreductase
MSRRYPCIPLEGYELLERDEMLRRATGLCAELKKRRTVRQFSDRPVDRAVIEQCIGAAGTAPSGANRQPWHFVVVGDPELKRRIREAAEVEEREFYANRAPKEWLEALAPLGTDEHKPYLERAPWLIVIFAENYTLAEDGTKSRTYYATESVGIATGMLITAVHRAGLASLTHTPSPMRFLNELLDRPASERAYMILVVGHPEEDAEVPDITKKPLDEIATFR